MPDALLRELESDIDSLRKHGEALARHVECLQDDIMRPHTVHLRELQWWHSAQKYIETFRRYCRLIDYANKDAITPARSLLMSHSLREFLREQALKSKDKPCDPDKYYSGSPIEGYAEDVNNDALTDAWLEKGTSYIYKVGCLTLFDDNKRDFGWVFVGIERRAGDFEFLGSLYFRQGENTDCDRVMQRVMKCLPMSDIVFQED